MADPVPGIGDIYQVTFRSTLFNQMILNTFLYRLESTAGLTSVFSIYNDLDNYVEGAGSLKPTFLAVTPTNMTLNQIWIQRIYNGRVRKSVYGVGLPGSAGAAANTANQAASIERRGDLANKHNVGRLQVVIPSGSTWQDSGEVTSAGLTALVDLADAMTSTLTGGPGTTIFTPVLARKTGLTYSFDYITVATPQLTVRTMRRRTVGVGK